MSMMRATRRCYVQSMSKEFAAGETFSVSDEKEVRRLLRRRTAEVAGAPAVSQPSPAPSKQMEVPATPVTPLAEEDSSVDDESEKPKRSRRTGYNRRDMRAEEE